MDPTTAADISDTGVAPFSKRRSSVRFATITEVDEDNSASADNRDWRTVSDDRQSFVPEAVSPNPENRRSAHSSRSSNVMSALGRFTSRFSDSDARHIAETASNYSDAISSLPQSRSDENEHKRRTTLWSREPPPSSYTTDGDDNSIHGPEFVSRLSDPHANKIWKLINHRAWKSVFYCCSFIMLFGSQIQDLYFPKSWDKGTDLVFTLVFVFSSIDIFLHVITDPTYFTWGLNKRDRNVGLCCGIYIGSFFFWCDVFATGTFLYEISYVTAKKRSVREVLLTLNNIGVPIFGMNSINNTAPVEVEYEFLITLGRVARIARFITTSTIVTIYSYFQPKYFYLGYWKAILSDFAHHCFQHREEESSPGMSQDFIARSTSTDARSLSYSVNSHPSTKHILKRQLSASSIEGMANTRNMAGNKNGRLSSSLNDIPTRKLTGSFKRSVQSSQTLQTVSEDKEPTSNNSKQGLASRGKNFFGHISDAIESPPSKAPDESENKSQTIETVATAPRKHKKPSSHVGSAMRELTGQRVALGIMMFFFLTVLFTYSEVDGTMAMTSITLHGQTGNEQFANLALTTARTSVIPELFRYMRFNGTEVVIDQHYALPDGHIEENLREREILNVTVQTDGTDIFTTGMFDNRRATYERAKVELLTTLFEIFVWIIGVTWFAGPVMTLVVEPIERMIFLLSMLMKDPLGYESTPQYQEFIQDGDGGPYKSFWRKEVLNGMETNFLMSTILRIGSLMKVGFGSAGVEIIRNNLEKGRRKDVLFLNKQGSSVSCIFLFCDIRSFTDATECLQEEVFVFTNKIAAVVHSICNSHGGAANKNIGDAFLLSWLLDEPERQEEVENDIDDSYQETIEMADCLYAYNNQADKALLSVVNISIALHFDAYFVESMTGEARDRLISKMSKRKGPLVQMGFGLHAGKAVQGAIGSQRKLDATYISESVERAEFLESSTKKYGVPVLMSDAFYNLLDHTNKYRCRKIDQLLIFSEEDDSLSTRDIMEHGEKMELYTYDMDIDALFTSLTNEDDNSISSDTDVSTRGKRRPTRLTKSLTNTSSDALPTARRTSIVRKNNNRGMENFAEVQLSFEDTVEKSVKTSKLLLPTGISRYSERIWLEPYMRKIRRVFVSNGIFFQKFDDGLKSYYAKDWDHSKGCFQLILSSFGEDGPSRYFLKLMEEHNGQPPKNFLGYGR